MNQPNPFAANAALLSGLANLPDANSLPPALSSDTRTRSAGTPGRNSSLIIASYFGHPSEAVVAAIGGWRFAKDCTGIVSGQRGFHVDAPTRHFTKVDGQLSHPIINNCAEPRHNVLLIPRLIFVMGAD
jgi:hypothetical protein